MASFQAVENAEKVRQEASMRLTDPVSVASADTAKGLYFRVMVGPYLDRSTAELGALQAQEAGYEGCILYTSDAADDIVESVLAKRAVAAFVSISPTIGAFREIRSTKPENPGERLRS